MKRRAMLLILDGFGEGKPEDSNAIYSAHPPFINTLRKTAPWSLVEPGGAEVGLLPGQAGQSDVGHNTIGSGRIIRQPIKIVYDAIQDGSFFRNTELLSAIKHAERNNGNLHLIGIGSDSYVHGIIAHISALLKLIKQEGFDGNRVFLHLAGDGRDNPARSAESFLTTIEAECKKYGVGKIASLIGRFYIMDRGKNWDRTAKAYSLLTDSSQKFVKGWKEALKKDYAQDISDEFFSPWAFGDDKIFPRIQDGDGIINFCYRADRERQITRALTDPDFTEFERKRIRKDLYYTGFIPYFKDYPYAHNAFEEESPTLCLSEVLDTNKFKQYHIAGKEKVIFVTYNINRSSELKLPTETDACAPQTKEVETFDKNPEMSAPYLTKMLLEELDKDEQDVYIVNYENCDQVGHTGVLSAAREAVKAVDLSLSHVVPKALEKGFEVLITADHGNADVMIDENGEPHMAHTTNKVPCFFVSSERKAELKNGTLSDIAPTFLHILGVGQPREMTGENLIKFL